LGGDLLDLLEVSGRKLQAECPDVVFEVSALLSAGEPDDFVAI
jgi:hypothetical protein